MEKYQKIQTIYKRDENKKVILGNFSRPEFEYLQNVNWRYTEKVDGTNIRIIFQPYSDKMLYHLKQKPTQVLYHRNY